MIEIYRNYYGSEDIAKSNTVEHVEDPTAALDQTYHSQEEEVKASFKDQIAQVQAEINAINRWTGKSHSCTKTTCPTRKKGKGTIGAHWKGTLTAFGSEQLARLKQKRSDLEAKRDEEIAGVRQRRTTVMQASVSAFNRDVDRYKRELSLKNQTFKGFVFIAFPAAFIIAFLLSDITYMGIEYLYESGRLERPIVTGSRDGSSVMKTATDSRHGKALTDSLVEQRFSNRQCVNCGTDIQHKRRDAKTCSDGCRIAYNEWKNGYSVAAAIKNRSRS